MPVAAVICEYNPFHLGHARQLRLLRERLGEDAALLCLMSGGFVQRGEPAVFSKAARARAAALCGADLVLELPLTCALRSAEGFAQGGVAVLQALGAVDYLCFGSESGDLSALDETAARLLSPAFDGAVRAALTSGVSYAAARAAALEALGGNPALLRRPNDILAVEYLKALRRLECAITPVTHRRPGDYHDGAPDLDHPSATALRAMVVSGGDWTPYVPPAAAEVFRNATPYAMAWGERAVLARLRTLPDAAFAALPGGGEGLWRRFMAAARREADTASVLRAVKSKRYAYSRLRRMLLCAYLGLSAADLEMPPPYVRALAFTDRGRALLRRLRRESRIPVVNAGETPPDPAYYALERQAADLGALFARDGADPGGGEARVRVFCADAKKSEKTLA